MSDPALSLMFGVVFIAGATLYGRFGTKSRGSIAVAGVLGALGAMGADILVDGQGAFILLLYAPLIYGIAAVGRHDLTN